MSTAEAGIKALPPTAARMVAVEVLLAEPESLDDDVLEACLYMCATKRADALPAERVEIGGNCLWT